MSENKVYVLGVGPGTGDYLLPITREIAADCDVLIGGRRALSLFPSRGRELIEIDSDLKGIISFISKHRDQQRIAVLASGDPGLYGILKVLLEEFSPEDLQVFPGISSMQLAFARARLPWHDAEMRSLHARRDDDLCQVVKESEVVGIFTDEINTPHKVVSRLLEEGIDDCRVFVGSRLAYPEERTYQGSLQGLLQEEEFEMAVMVIYSEN